jgi:hypothetical protein
MNDVSSTTKKATESEKATINLIKINQIKQFRVNALKL